MGGFYHLVPTLVAVIVALLIIRVGALALMMTGMSFETAKFQALSAFSGTGFTTRESERVVNNARRRKIISWLMVFGNAGIVTVIVTASSSFTKMERLETGINLLVLIGGLLLFLAVTRFKPLVRRWESFVEGRLRRLSIFEEDTSVDELLHLTEGYGVVRIRLEHHSALIGKTLGEVNSSLDHSFVLGIERDKDWIPTPRLSRKLMAEDYLVIYGHLDNISKHFG